MKLETNPVPQILKAMTIEFIWWRLIYTRPSSLKKQEQQQQQQQIFFKNIKWYKTTTATSPFPFFGLIFKHIRKCQIILWCTKIGQAADSYQKTLHFCFSNRNQKTFHQIQLQPIFQHFMPEFLGYCKEFSIPVSLRGFLLSHMKRWLISARWVCLVII